MTIDDARVAMLAMLAARASDATVCPSEVARAMTPDGDDWREAMPIVHAASDSLFAGREVELSWKGKSLEARAGPYRIGRGTGS